MYVHISLTSLLTAVNSIHFNTCLRCITITGNIYKDITSIDQNVGIPCTEARLRCLWILDVLVLIYLIKMWV